MPVRWSERTRRQRRQVASSTRSAHRRPIPPAANGHQQKREPVGETCESVEVVQHGDGGEPLADRDCADQVEDLELVGDVERAGGLGRVTKPDVKPSASVERRLRPGKCERKGTLRAWIQQERSCLRGRSRRCSDGEDWWAGWLRRDAQGLRWRAGHGEQRRRAANQMGHRRTAESAVGNRKSSLRDKVARRTQKAFLLPRLMG